MLAIEVGFHAEHRDPAENERVLKELLGRREALAQGRSARTPSPASSSTTATAGSASRRPGPIPTSATPTSRWTWPPASPTTSPPWSRSARADGRMPAMTDTERFELQRPIPAAGGRHLQDRERPGGARRHRRHRDAAVLHGRAGHQGRRRVRDPHGPRVAQRLPARQVRRHRQDHHLRAGQEIAWTILGQLEPPIGHVYGYRLEPGEEDGTTLVTQYYDWSDIHQQWRNGQHLPDHLRARHPGHARDPRAHRSTSACRRGCDCGDEDGSPRGDRRQAARGRARRHRGLGRRAHVPGARQELRLLRPTTPAASA